MSSLKYMPETRKTAGSVTMVQQTVVTEPWEMLDVDLMPPLPRISVENTQLLVVVDHYTQWVELFSLCNATASTVSKYLQKDKFYTLGYSKVYPVAVPLFKTCHLSLFWVDIRHSLEIYMFFYFYFLYCHVGWPGL